MQNNSLVKVFGVLFALVSIYQLSFTFISSSVESQAENFAKQAVSEDTTNYLEARDKKITNYLDSIGNNTIYGFTSYNDAKAKELRMFIEPLVTYAKRGDLHARRQVLRRIRHKSIVRELFDNIGPVFSNRDGGYTRITKLGYRDNDCAPISMIEFVDMIVEVETQGEEK